MQTVLLDTLYSHLGILCNILYIVCTYLCTLDELPTKQTAIKQGITDCDTQTILRSSSKAWEDFLIFNQVEVGNVYGEVYYFLKAKIHAVSYFCMILRTMSL